MAARLEATARHEAAHACMAARLGRTVTRLVIRDDHSGFCEIAPPRYPRTPENGRRAAKENLMISLAANLVEQAPEPIPGWWRL